MSKYEKFEKGAQKIATKDVARWLYIASACRLWLRETGRVRRERNRPVSRWDWSSSTAVMR